MSVTKKCFRSDSRINRKVLLVCSIVLFLVPLFTQAEIIFDDDFEDSATGNPPTNQSSKKLANWGNCSGNCTIVTTEQARSGKKSLKTYLNRNKSSTSFRTEAVPRGAARKPDKGVDYWYGFSTFIPNSHIPDYKAPDTIAQWHTATGHPVTLWVDGTDLVLAVRDENSGGIDRFELGPYKKNVWTDWVVHVKWSNKNDGLVELWKNGNKLVSHKGVNMLNEPGAGWLKLGLYKTVWRDNKRQFAGQRFDANIVERVFYHDEVRIASGRNAKFSDVDPSRSGPSTSASSDKVEPPKNVKITFE